MITVATSYEALHEPHQSAFREARKKVAEALLKFKGVPLGTVDLVLAISTAAFVLETSTRVLVRIVLACLITVAFPLVLWLGISLVWTTVVLRRQRDEARRDRDWWRIEAELASTGVRTQTSRPPTLEDVESLVHFYRNWGKEYYRKTRRPGVNLNALHHDVAFWAAKADRVMSSVHGWRDHWGPPGDPPRGRKELRVWIKDRLRVLRGMY